MNTARKTDTGPQRITQIATRTGKDTTAVIEHLKLANIKVDAPLDAKGKRSILPMQRWM